MTNLLLLGFFAQWFRMDYYRFGYPSSFWWKENS